MFVSAVLLLLCLCFVLLQLKPRRPKNFPPGPPSLPIVGNVLQLSLRNPLNDFERLRKSYGNVYSLFIGARPVVVLSGVRAIKEALVTRGTDFAGRPQDLFVNDVTRRKGVIFVDYGCSWREHRRFALTTLKNFGMGRNSMEDRIHDELQHTVESLENGIGDTLRPQGLLHKTSFNIISQMLFATRYDHEDEILNAFVSYIKENTKIGNGPWCVIYDSFPKLRNLPLPFKKAFENFENISKVVVGLVSEHKKTRVPGEPRHFVDCYLDEMDKKRDDSSFSEEEFTTYALDLLTAGSDTVSSTLLTAFLYLMSYPHIQERCQQEVDRELGGKERVDFDDRYNMPYTQAVIHEAQRVANVAPLSIFHCTIKDTELMGYSIPKGTMIIENLTSVLNEEGQWKFPHEFSPENFLDEQGQFVQPEAFMPFSAGPRVCLGESLARMELFLILVTLLRKFKFIWPEDAGEPDFTPVYGITMTTQPYRMKVQLRSTQ
ncbi:cytochrome P450 2F2-like [Salarias fasciatus]|uniref:Cytochrome P450 2F2-like n=1 Tax=Salarias fasciatus TaxID=181472 RepID=A0A672F6I8_SALFA|nr:cytochrome P450 2F2-like [Salarias fasciatus]